ncbi:hypothetical protein Bca101_012544 [Brassica carinata]
MFWSYQCGCSNRLSPASSLPPPSLTQRSDEILIKRVCEITKKPSAILDRKCLNQIRLKELQDDQSFLPTPSLFLRRP